MLIFVVATKCHMLIKRNRAQHQVRYRSKLVNQLLGLVEHHILGLLPAAALRLQAPVIQLHRYVAQVLDAAAQVAQSLARDIGHAALLQRYCVCFVVVGCVRAQRVFDAKKVLFVVSPLFFLFRDA